MLSADHQQSATFIIAINQPRTSYFVGGSEVVSLEHARSWLRHGLIVVFYTLDPTSIGMQYSELFLRFKEEYGDHPSLYLRELRQDPKAISIYATIPGEDKKRWYIESMLYNRPLYEALLAEPLAIDVLFSYYQFDALTIPSAKVGKNVLYISGIPSSENNLRVSQLAMYDQLFAISEAVQVYWQRYDDRLINVIPTGVTIPQILPQPTPGNSKYSVVFAGRLIERKGCMSLVEAAVLLPDTLKANVHLTILGDGPQRQTLEELVNANGLELQVEFKGLVENPTEFFGVADLCVFPSLRGEGLMGVVLEAMAAQACVVSTYGNGNEALLSDGRGVLFEGGDAKGLATIMSNLLPDPTQRLTIGRAAREFVRQNYSWDQQTARLFATIVI